KAPRDCSKPTAIGRPPKRSRSLATQAALAQLGHPRAKHRGLLLQRAGLDFPLADHLQAEGVFLVRPVQGQKGRKLLGGVRFGIVLQHSFGLFASKTRWLILGEGLIESPADNSGPPLSIREGPARRPARRTTLSHRVTSLGIRSRAMRVFPVRGKEMAVHAKRFFARRRVIHRSCGEQTRRALLASMNNSGGTISLRVASGCLPVGYHMACGWPRGQAGTRFRPFLRKQ